MSDYGDLLGVIKRSALEAMEASQPVRIYYGSVIGTEPLRILVDQRLTLGAAQVVLTRNVTDYEVRVTKDDEDGTTDTVIVHNALKMSFCADNRVDRSSWCLKGWWEYDSGSQCAYVRLNGRGTAGKDIQDDRRQNIRNSR